MGILDGLALVCFILGAVAAVIVLVHAIDAGMNSVTLWVALFVVVALLTASAFYLQARINERVPGPSNATNEQDASEGNPPVSTPVDSVNAADAKQVDGQRTDGGVGDQKSSQPARGYWLEVLGIVFAGAVAAATIFLAVFGAVQVTGIARQLKLAEIAVDQTRLDQRAWLGPTQPTMKDPIAGEPIDAVLPVKNFGRTPGFIKRIVAVVFKAPKGTDIESHIAKIDGLTELLSIRDSSLAPDATWKFRIGIVPTLDENELISFGKNELNLFLYGKMFYQDVSKVEHWTEVCFIYDREAKAWFACDKHNLME